MGRSGSLVVALVSGVVVVGGAGPGIAQARGLRVTFAFGDRTTATATTAHIHVEFPTDAHGRPKQLRGLDFQFPAGTKIDRSVAPQCRATDAEVNQNGADACPAATQVGFGAAKADTGVGPPVDPLPADAHTFNTPTGTVNVFTPRGLRAPTLYRTRQRYAGLWVRDSFPPPPPGFPPPNGKSLPLEADFVLAKKVGRRSWLTTPRRCRHAWTAHIVLTFTGGARQASTATTPCRPGSRR